MTVFALRHPVPCRLVSWPLLYASPPTVCFVVSDWISYFLHVPILQLFIGGKHHACDVFSCLWYLRSFHRTRLIYKIGNGNLFDQFARSPLSALSKVLLLGIRSCFRHGQSGSHDLEFPILLSKHYDRLISPYFDFVLSGIYHLDNLPFAPRDHRGDLWCDILIFTSIIPTSMTLSLPGRIKIPPSSTPTWKSQKNVFELTSENLQHSARKRSKVARDPLFVRTFSRPCLVLSGRNAVGCLYCKSHVPPRTSIIQSSLHPNGLPPFVACFGASGPCTAVHPHLSTYTFGPWITA